MNHNHFFSHGSQAITIILWFIIRRRAHYATDDVNLFGENIGLNSSKKNTGVLLHDSKKIRLEINPVKTKYIFMAHNHNMGRNRNTKMANKSFEYVSEFKYLWMSVTNLHWRNN
jgi:hypothetical protein